MLVWLGLTIIYIGHCGMDTGPLGLSCGIWHLQIESGSLQILWVAERESVDTVRSSAFHGCLIGCGSRLFRSSGPCAGLFDLFLKLFLSSFCYLAGTSSCWETPLVFGNFSWSPTFKRVDQVQLKPQMIAKVSWESSTLQRDDQCWSLHF